MRLPPPRMLSLLHPPFLFLPASLQQVFPGGGGGGEEQPGEVRWSFRVGGKVLLIPSRWVCLTSGCVGGPGPAAGGADASRPDNNDVVDSSAPPALAQKFSYMLIWG